MTTFPYLASLQLLLLVSLHLSTGLKILLSNDDGWAVAQIRAEYDALVAASYDVVMSAPAVDKSGTGSSTATPSVVVAGCQYGTCPPLSPATGSDATDPNLNYVNAFPVDAVSHGLAVTAPARWSSGPDLVVCGSNVGNNLNWVVDFSGTVGAATEAAQQGYPSIAFSSGSGAQVSYTTLTSNPTSSSSVAAFMYSTLVVNFVDTLVASSAPYLPTNTTLNVNFAPMSSTCSTASAYKFVLTRIYEDPSATDVTTCGSSHLPDEAFAITQGCIATVSVMNAWTKGDVSAAEQSAVLSKLTSILECL
ncbi:sure-like protein [Coprinopsis sp. MPI-PUGE-AT-0042]|nr:sure-like protein [Coprinopsis sp. MPI-PUGE-AT-0042]